MVYSVKIVPPYYIGDTKRTLEDRVKEHNRWYRFGRPDESAIAAHAIMCDHSIARNSAFIVEKEKNFHHRKIKEALTIYQHPNNCKRDTGVYVSPVWKTIQKPLHLD